MAKKQISETAFLKKFSKTALAGYSKAVETEAKEQGLEFQDLPPNLNNAIGKYTGFRHGDKNGSLYIVLNGIADSPESIRGREFGMYYGFAATEKMSSDDRAAMFVNDVKLIGIEVPDNPQLLFQTLNEAIDEELWFKFRTDSYTNKNGQERTSPVPQGPAMEYEPSEETVQVVGDDDLDDDDDLEDDDNDLEDDDDNDLEDEYEEDEDWEPEKDEEYIFKKTPRVRVTIIVTRVNKRQQTVSGKDEAGTLHKDIPWSKLEDIEDEE